MGISRPSETRSMRTYTHQNILVSIVLKKSTDHLRETVLFFSSSVFVKIRYAHVSMQIDISL